MENQQTNFPLSCSQWPGVNSRFWGQPRLSVKRLCLSLLAPPYFLDFRNLKSQGAHPGQASPVLLDWMLVVGIRRHLRDKGQPGAAALQLSG